MVACFTLILGLQIACLLSLSSGLDWTRNNYSLSHPVQKFKILSWNLVLVEAYSQYPEMHKIPWMWKRLGADPDIYTIFY